MKKLLIAMAALMTLAFVGCEKEEETATDALTGTTWESSYGGTPLTVSFNAGGVVTLNMGSETYTGTYTYKAPDVTIQMPIDGQNVTFTGTYSNGTLNISSDEYGSFVFTQTGGPSLDESGDDGGSGGSIQGPAAGVKLVKQVTDTQMDYGYTSTNIYNVEYDEYNRMVKVTAEGDENIGTVLFSYSGNEITVKELNLTLVLTLNKNGYIIKETCKEYEGGEVTFSYDRNGCMINGTGSYKSKRESYSYDWRNGNLVTKSKGGHIERELTYDESKTLVPTNVNFATISETIDVFFLEGTAPRLLDIWGKQCKSPLKQVVYNGSYVEEYSYEYYEDGSVSKIKCAHSEDGNIRSSRSIEFTYL